MFMARRCRAVDERRHPEESGAPQADEATQPQGDRAFPLLGHARRLHRNEADADARDEPERLAGRDKSEHAGGDARDQEAHRDHVGADGAPLGVFRTTKGERENHAVSPLNGVSAVRDDLIHGEPRRIGVGEDAGGNTA